MSGRVRARRSGIGHDIRVRRQRHVIARHDHRLDAKPGRELGTGRAGATSSAHSM